MDRVTKRRPQNLLDSFNFAFEGIIHVLRTQRNMRIHFVAASSCWWPRSGSGVTRLELIALLLSIAFVLIAEMINSAIEQAIDVATTSFDPLAKLAKDIAAGAVLIATVNAVAVGYLVFSGQVADRSSRLLDRLRDAPAQADADRARADDPRRDRDEGVHRPRHAAARRAAVRARGGRLRRLDGGDATSSATRTASWSRRSRSSWRCSSRRPASSRASTRPSRSPTAACSARSSRSSSSRCW